MLDELPMSPAGGPVAAETPAAGQPVPANQPQPGGDSRLEAILQKKSAGEKLTAGERGYLGAVKKRGTPKTVAAPANENPLLEIPENRDNPLFADEVAATLDGPVAPAVDPALLRRTANALLNTLDTVTKTYVGHEAKSAGGDAQTVADYKAAVALRPENRDLMLEGSEPVVLTLCKMFKCSPEMLESVLKSSGFVGGLAMHALAVSAAVKSIRESRKEMEAKKKLEETK